jgi:hypothetical protein
MTREQIIEILGKYSIVKVWYDERVSIVSAPQKEAREELADAILALPLEVPSDNFEFEYATNYVKDMEKGIGRAMLHEGIILGMRKMREEIIKRNK